MPYIDLNPPWVYMCSPSWTPLPPPSPSHPSGSSQCTNPKHPVSCIKPGLAIHFTYDNLHVSMPLSHIILPSPSPTEFKRLFNTSVSLLLSLIQGYRYLLSKFHIYAFSSVQSLSHARLFATSWITARQASLSITNSQSSLKLMSIELVLPSSHLILCRPLLLPPVPPSIRVFSNESTLRMRWPKYWSFSFSISPSNEHPGLILQSKGLSRVFSNTTVQKHQFFGGQLSSQSKSHIHTWPLKKPYPWLDGPLLAK